MLQILWQVLKELIFFEVVFCTATDILRHLILALVYYHVRDDILLDFFAYRYEIHFHVFHSVRYDLVHC